MLLCLRAGPIFTSTKQLQIKVISVQFIVLERGLVVRVSFRSSRPGFDSLVESDKNTLKKRSELKG